MIKKKSFISVILFLVFLATNSYGRLLCCNPDKSYKNAEVAESCHPESKNKNETTFCFECGCHFTMILFCNGDNHHNVHISMFFYNFFINSNYFYFDYTVVPPPKFFLG